LVSILGFSSGSVPRAERAEVYARLCRHLAAGEIEVQTQVLPLAEVEQAWALQQASPHAKLVLKP